MANNVEYNSGKSENVSIDDNITLSTRVLNPNTTNPILRLLFKSNDKTPLLDKSPTLFYDITLSNRGKFEKCEVKIINDNGEKTVVKTLNNLGLVKIEPLVSKITADSIAYKESQFSQFSKILKYLCVTDVYNNITNPDLIQFIKDNNLSIYVDKTVDENRNPIFICNIINTNNNDDRLILQINVRTGLILIDDKETNILKFRNNKYFKLIKGMNDTLFNEFLNNAFNGGFAYDPSSD